MADTILKGELFDDDAEVSVGELCRACATSTEWVVELVEEGVLEPTGGGPRQWRFTGRSLHRAYRARRLQQDLELDAAGVALALDLLERIDALHERLRRLEAGRG